MKQAKCGIVKMSICSVRHDTPLVNSAAADADDDDDGEVDEVWYFALLRRCRIALSGRCLAA